MRTLIYRPLALTDLGRIYEIVGADYPQRGADYVQAVREHCRKNLLAFPKLGVERSDLGDGIYLYVIKSKRTIVAYRIGETEIIITRVFYAGADYQDMLRDMEDVDQSAIPMS